MLGLLNVDSILTEELSKSLKIQSLDVKDCECDAIFVDWLPTTDKTASKKLIRQVEVMEKFIKLKLPILIFDRYRGITSKEMDFFRKNNCKLFEPSIYLRSGFKYLPQWIKIKGLHDIEIDDHDRPISILYKGQLLSERVKGFDDYYVECAKIHHKHKICYNSVKTIPTKVSEYDQANVKYVDDGFNNAKFTIVIGSNPEYKEGFIDNTFFEAINQNCVPLLPIEHRYFCGLKSVSVDPSSLYWYLENKYEHIYLGLLFSLYEEIGKYYGEFDVKNVAGEIRRNL